MFCVRKNYISVSLLDKHNGSKGHIKTIFIISLTFGQQAWANIMEVHG